VFESNSIAYILIVPCAAYCVYLFVVTWLYTDSRRNRGGACGFCTRTAKLSPSDGVAGAGAWRWAFIFRPKRVSELRCAALPRARCARISASGLPRRAGARLLVRVQYATGVETHTRAGGGALGGEGTTVGSHFDVACLGVTPTALGRDAPAAATARVHRRARISHRARLSTARLRPELVNARGKAGPAILIGGCDVEPLHDMHHEWAQPQRAGDVLGHVRVGNPSPSIPNFRKRNPPLPQSHLNPNITQP